MAESEANFTVRRVGPVTVVRLTREHISDTAYVDELGGELEALLEAASPPDLLIDFGEVAFLTSSFLGKIIRLSKLAAARHGRLRLCAVRPRILEVFQVVRLDRLVEIHPTADDALAPSG